MVGQKLSETAIMLLFITTSYSTHVRHFQIEQKREIAQSPIDEETFEHFKDRNVQKKPNEDKY